MSRARLAILGTAVVLAAAGCNGTPPAPPASSGPPTSSTAASASPTSTLSPDQAQAFQEATDVVLAFRQTWVDLYTGARTNINDLNDVVAVGDLLDASVNQVSQDLAAGVTAGPKGAQVTLANSAPESIKLMADPPTVVLTACVDLTSVTTRDPDGTTSPGVREEATYTVIKTTYLPDPGWGVLKMEGPPDAEDRRC